MSGARRNEDAFEDEHEEGEDLFEGDIAADYQAIRELDEYDPAYLDDSDENEELSVAGRQAAEREMAIREGRYDRMGHGLIYGEDDDEDGPATKRVHRRHAENEENADQMIPESISNLEDHKGYAIREWVVLAGPRHEIYNRFKHFLRTFTTDDGANIYRERIRQMMDNFHGSLTVSWRDLAMSKEVLAFFLPEAPLEMLAIFDEAAKDLIFSMYPNYAKVIKVIRVRISELPIMEDLRSLRQNHLNQLVRCSGIVSSVSPVLPQLDVAFFDCSKCGFVVGPLVQQGSNVEAKPNACPECQSRGPFGLNAQKTVFQNFQRVLLQETPNNVQAGRVPRVKELVLTEDLVDTCRPGQEIEVTGTYTNNYDSSLNAHNGFPVFATMILANHIVCPNAEGEDASKLMTETDLAEIKRLTKCPDIVQQVVASIAPSIYGQDELKLGIALSLFGGVAKNPSDEQGGGKSKHRIRGDINVLMCGDPGMAKSQILKFLVRTAPRAILSTGQGASGVGLTAYVHKSPTSHEWTLEAGAMVLADQGHCLIDEFDKISDQDRVAIHEALEQQSISISKAGIVTSLQARCAVIAAANPIGGRYDASLTFADNVDLTEPILSRFDVLAVLQDIVDPVSDEKLAKFVTDCHDSYHPDHQAGKTGENADVGHAENDATKPPIRQDLLRKYIAFARATCFPKLGPGVDQDRITRLYADLRREAQATGCLPIGVRHIESIMRMCEAHAKIHLRPVVTEVDVDAAIKVVLHSFISAQKFSGVKAMRRTFAKYLNAGKRPVDLVAFTLAQAVREERAFQASRLGGADNVNEVKIPIKRLMTRMTASGSAATTDKELRTCLATLSKGAKPFSVKDNVVVHPCY